MGQHPGHRGGDIDGQHGPIGDGFRAAQRLMQDAGNKEDVQPAGEELPQRERESGWSDMEAAEPDRPGKPHGAEIEDGHRQREHRYGQERAVWNLGQLRQPVGARRERNAADRAVPQ